MSNVPTFGVRIKNKSYKRRDGAYAVIFGENNTLAVIKASKGYFLPGGGVEAGESIEKTLVREIQEECGRLIEIKYKIGEAIDYLYAESEDTYFEKYGHFYFCKFLNSQFDTPLEKSVNWLSLESAGLKLKQKGHAWAVNQLK